MRGGGGAGAGAGGGAEDGPPLPLLSSRTATALKTYRNPNPRSVVLSDASLTLTAPYPMWGYEPSSSDFVAFGDKTSDLIESVHWYREREGGGGGGEAPSAEMEVTDKGIVYNISFCDMIVMISDKKCKLQRGTWFFKGEKDMLPYSSDICSKLENALQKGSFELVRVSEKPPRDVILLAHGGFKQVRRTAHADPGGRPVNRGWDGRICKYYKGYPFPPHQQTFGVPLDILMKHPMNSGCEMPLLFNICVKILMVQGPKTEGIFRLSGSRNKIDEVRRSWESGNTVEMERYEIEVVGGVLKEFVRDLPVCLGVNDYFNSWLEIAKISDEARFIQNIQVILCKIPKIHHLMLRDLFLLFHSITKEERVTRMNAKNIAVCWTPNIFRAHDQQQNIDKLKEEMDAITKLVTTIIEKRDKIFKQ